MVAQLNVRRRVKRKGDVRPQRIKQYHLEPTTKGGKPRCNICRRCVYTNQKQEYCNEKIRHLSCWPIVSEEWNKTQNKIMIAPECGEQFAIAYVDFKREQEKKELDVKQLVEKFKKNNQT